MNLHYFKQIGFAPTSILDIGCNVGQFYKLCKSVWGDDIKIVLIDGNRNVEKDLISLNVDYHIELLSNNVKEVTFYLNKSNLKCTGSSYYKENTNHYIDENIIKENRLTTTLDDLFPNGQFDLIKIDTQGSEIDIMCGGEKLCRNAKYILLEASHVEYNINAPLIIEVDKYMKKNKFEKLKIIDNRNINGKLTQSDIIYKKI